MTRKSALAAESAVHFFLCYLARVFLSGDLPLALENDRMLVGAGTVIFLVLALGLRPFLGVFLDELPRFHSQTLGCLLAGLSVLLPSDWIWWSLMLLAVGYALFLAGAGGESLAFARGYFARSSVLLGAGSLGAVTGSLVGALPDLLLIVLSAVAAAASFYFSETRKYPRRIRSFRHSVRTVLSPTVTLFLLLIPALAVSLVGSLLPAATLGGAVLYLAPLCGAVGCGVGGLACDRFGPRMATLFAFGIALPLLTVFTHIPWLYCIGVAALHMPLSAVLGASTAILSTRPHFAFGLCGAVLLLGGIPALFPITVTATVRMISAAVLILGGAVGYFLFTDHCKLFGFYGLIRKKGVGR